jgi:hypothetical protein
MNVVTLGWSTPDVTRAVVELGTTNRYGLTMQVPQLGRRHHLTIRGLAPNIVYSYRIANSTSAGARVSVATGSFRTAPVGPTAFATRGTAITAAGAPFIPVVNALRGRGSCHEFAGALVASGVGNVVSIPLSGCGGSPAEDGRDAIDGKAWGIVWSDGEVSDPRMLGGIACCAIADPEPRPSTWPSGRLYIGRGWSLWDRPAPPGAILPAAFSSPYPHYLRDADVISTWVPTDGNRWFASVESVPLARVFDAQFALLARGKPVIQEFFATSTTGRVAHTLTPAYLNAEVWLALAAGAAGIGYRGDIVALEPAMRVHLATTSSRIATLGPALAVTPTRVPLARGSSVRASSRTFGGTTYVIAVNATRRPLDARIPLRGRRGTASVLWENRRVRLRGTAIVDRFEPLAVHVYALS